MRAVSACCSLSRSPGPQVAAGKGHKRQQISGVQHTCQSYALAWPALALTLTCDRDPAVRWKKPAAATLSEAATSLFGPLLVAQLVAMRLEVPGGHLSGLIPAAEADADTVSRSTQDRCFIFVNRRPVDLPGLYQALRVPWQQRTGCSRQPFAVLQLHIAPAAVDVNVSTDKRKCFLAGLDAVVAAFGEHCQGFYAPPKVGFAEDQGDTNASQATAAADPMASLTTTPVPGGHTLAATTLEGWVASAGAAATEEPRAAQGRRAHRVTGSKSKILAALPRRPRIMGSSARPALRLGGIAMAKAWHWAYSRSAPGPQAHPRFGQGRG